MESYAARRNAHKVAKMPGAFHPGSNIGPQGERQVKHVVHYLNGETHVEAADVISNSADSIINVANENKKVRKGRRLPRPVPVPEPKETSFEQPEDF